MYKSSVWRTYYYRYGTVPVFIGIFLFYYLNVGSQFNLLMLFIISLLLWAAVWTAFLIIRLRVVTATLDGLFISHTKNNIEKIDYKNMIWIYQPRHVNPHVVIFKYFSSIQQKEKKILFINRFDFESFPFMNKETPMLQFIRAQIEKANPSYNSENEPSRSTLSIIEFLSMIIVIVLFGLIISNI